MFFYIILLETFLYMVLVSLSYSSYEDKDVWLKSLDFFFVFPLNNGFSVIGVMRLDSRFAWWYTICKRVGETYGVKYFLPQKQCRWT